MPGPLFAALAVAITTLFGSIPPAHSVGLVADLSHRLIAITTAFAGTEVLLFGALEEPGSEVVVLVKGPPVDTTVRRKSRLGPIWLNTSELTFKGVPAYLALAASRPIAQLLPPAERARYQLGPAHFALEPIGAAGTSDPVRLTILMLCRMSAPEEASPSGPSAARSGRSGSPQTRPSKEVSADDRQYDDAFDCTTKSSTLRWFVSRLRMSTRGLSTSVVPRPPPRVS